MIEQSTDVHIRETELTEAQVLEQDGRHILEVTLIRPGTSKNGNHYPTEVLREALPHFEGARCFVDHQREGDLPERSVRDLVGYYRQARVAEGGKLRAQLHLIPGNESLFHLLREAEGNPNLCGLSIDAVAEVAHEGGLRQVRGFRQVSSVDIVTRPSAGGQVERVLQSDREPDRSTLQESRMDPNENGQTAGSAAVATTEAVTPAAPTATQPTAAEPTLAQLVEQLNAERQRMSEELARVHSILNPAGAAPKNEDHDLARLAEEIRRERDLTRAEMVLNTRLAESGLPTPVSNKLRARFTGRVFDATTLEAAITEEKDVLAQLSASGQITGMGYEKHVTMGMSEYDQVQAAMDKLFDITESDAARSVPAFSGIREAFRVCTGIDISQIGGVDRPLRESLGSALRAKVAGGRLTESEAILREADVTTVMFARQMGKNETSAQIEAYLLSLYARRGGAIVKAAPSFKPQIINSILRLKDTLNTSPLTRHRWRPAFGYMVQVGRAGVTFLSADRQANVVGATASLLLEIDEAQDVDPEKYDRDFRPMASSTNATTVLYGTAWSEDSLLERQRRLNLEHEALTGERLHFEYDWTALATINAHYRAFVEAEIARLGTEHPSVQTQYLLRCLTDAGRLFSAEQREALRGLHERLEAPAEGCVYVAGIDIAGEDEQADDAQARLQAPRRDSTVVTIAEIGRNNSGQPTARVVEHMWWTGRDQVWQYENLLRLWDRWNFARVCVDASGIGRGLADFLEDRRPERVEKYVFTAPSKSRLAYGMLAMLNTGRLAMYFEDGSEQWREFWREVRACRYRLRAGEQIAWEVPANEGHDDFVTSLALVCRAAEELVPPAASMLLRAGPDDYLNW